MMRCSNVRFPRKTAIILLFLVVSVLAGCFAFFKSKGDLPTLEPYTPKEGEVTTLEVISVDLDAQRRVEIEVTLVDVASGGQETKVTALGWGARFNVTVGKEYRIIAKYNNIIKEFTFRMRPLVYLVVIIKNGQIERFEIADIYIM